MSLDKTTKVNEGLNKAAKAQIFVFFATFARARAYQIMINKTQRPRPFPNAAFVSLPFRFSLRRVKPSLRTPLVSHQGILASGVSSRPSRAGLTLRLTEQRQDVLRVAVGDRKGLDCQLLLGLQGLQTCRLFVHVGVHETANALFDRVRQLLGEVSLKVNA